MGWLEKRGDSYRFCFRYRGAKYGFALKCETPREADALAGSAKNLLLRLEQNLIELPIGVRIVEFLRSEGKATPLPAEAGPADERLETLNGLFEEYFAAHGPGVLEETTLSGMRIHRKHLEQTFGKRFVLRGLSAAALQRHVSRRAPSKGLRGRRLSPDTIRKELVTFRTAWNWAVKAGRLEGRFPMNAVAFPKTIEKPPFQTFEEVERQVAAGGLSQGEEADLWDSVFLALCDIKAVLAYVRNNASQPFVFPMAATAAYTGARRSELLRLRISDVDFERKTILISERKRVRGRTSTRRAPLSPKLEPVLKEWLADHPGGQLLFMQSSDVFRSKSPRSEPTPVTPDEAHDHLQRTLAGGKWKGLKGWHVFRHSFVSNCAAKGVDQRLIQAWTGHQTESMSARYRHLFPDQQRAAIKSVFG